MQTRRLGREGVLSAVAVALVASLAVALDEGSPLRRVVADGMLRASLAFPGEPGGAAAHARIPDVAIVALDPRSLRARPDWPWPRRFHADALRQLKQAGVRAVAFDIDFSSPAGGADDAAFAAALAAQGPAVLASFRQIQEAPGGAQLEIVNRPIGSLADAAAATGSVVVPVEPDGVVRFAPRVTTLGGRSIPSLAAAALSVATGLESADPDPIAIDYRRAHPDVPVLSMVDVIEGRFDRERVAGRVVFVGATAAEFQDLWSTPLGPARAGVWIQAMAYRTLAAEARGRTRLSYASPLERMLGIWLLSFAAAAIGTASHARRLVGLAALALAIGVGSMALLVGRGVLIDPVVPAATLAIHYALGLEGVRRRFRAGLEARDGSLSALVRVGEATASDAEGDGLATALALLGDVVDARGVALLRAGEDGRLDGRKLEWRRDGHDPVGCLDTAAEVLSAGRARIFEHGLPGGGGPGVAVYTPLHAGGSTVGVLVVERSAERPLDATQLRTIATVGAQLALSADNLRLIDGLRRTFETSIEAIGAAVEARDGYTESHCRRLAVFATRMAQRLGLSEEEIESIRLGALLHDVGKIGIQDAVLLKPGGFEPAERAEMESHADLGHGIIRQIHGMSDTTAACVRHHHEKWDGTGYPDRLSGEGIPIGARIVAVVDVWDALSTARPYKEAFAPEKVHEILSKGRGSHFDPALVDLFLKILDEEGEEMLALVQRGNSR